MYCSKCGSEIDNNARFCPKCGASTEAKPVCETESNISVKEAVCGKAEPKHSACAAATLTEGEGKRSLLSVIFAACALVAVIISLILTLPGEISDMIKIDMEMSKFFIVLTLSVGIIEVLPSGLMLAAALKRGKKKTMAGIAVIIFSLIFIISIISSLITYNTMSTDEIKNIAIIIVGLVGTIIMAIGLFGEHKKLSVIGGIVLLATIAVNIIINYVIPGESLGRGVNLIKKLLNYIQDIGISLAVIFFWRGNKKTKSI